MRRRIRPFIAQGGRRTNLAPEANRTRERMSRSCKFGKSWSTKVEEGTKRRLAVSSDKFIYSQDGFSLYGNPDAPNRCTRTITTMKHKVSRKIRFRPSVYGDLEGLALGQRRHKGIENSHPSNVCTSSQFCNACTQDRAIQCTLRNRVA